MRFKSTQQQAIWPHLAAGLGAEARKPAKRLVRLLNRQICYMNAVGPLSLPLAKLLLMALNVLSFVFLPVRLVVAVGPHWVC